MLAYASTLASHLASSLMESGLGVNLSSGGSLEFVYSVWL